MTPSIDHIDPLNGKIVCGLDNTLNTLSVDSPYNSRKVNRFVPYRLEGDVITHVEFGDWGTFLIGGEWVFCEFGGDEWWEESNRIGNATTAGGSANTPEQQRVRSEWGKEYGPKNLKFLSNHPNTVKARAKNLEVMNNHSNTVNSRKRNGERTGRENAKAMNNNPNTVSNRKRNGERTGKKNGEKNIQFMLNHPNLTMYLGKISKSLTLTNLETGEVVRVSSSGEASKKCGGSSGSWRKAVKKSPPKNTYRGWRVEYTNKGETN